MSAASVEVKTYRLLVLFACFFWVHRSPSFLPPDTITPFPPKFFVFDDVCFETFTEEKEEDVKEMECARKARALEAIFFFFSSPFVLRLARVYKCRNNKYTFLHGVKKKKKKKKKKFLQKKRKGTETNERNRVNK